jgi:aldehyde:ferredoxin oxidoreductase
MLTGGYHGTILRINLTHKTSQTEPFPESVARDFVGGAGLGVKYMLDEYYEARGWDKKTGIPTPEKLRELALEYVISEL